VEGNPGIAVDGKKYQYTLKLVSAAQQHLQNLPFPLRTDTGFGQSFLP